MSCRLYAITPPQLPDLDGFVAQLPRVLNAGDVACIQLRLKDVDDDTIKRAVAQMLPICEESDVALILNDRPDIAVLTGCDGVHIGPDDISYDEARKLVGDQASVGVSCKASRHMAMTAAEAGADYVAFGAFFPSPTKQNTESAPLDLIEIWAETTNVPSVAIGGITLENCQPLIDAGADFLAVSSGIWAHSEGAESAVRSFSERMAQ